MILRICMGIASLLSICLVGCGSGNNGSTSSGSNVSTTRQILAKNVLLTSAHASLADKGAAKKEVDATATVTADNVVIDTSGNSLSNTNLQDALDKEMAISLSKILPGTTWTIVNKTNELTYKDCPTGRVTFSSNTLTVEEGAFAAAGLLYDNSCTPIPQSSPITPISYEVLSNALMYVTWRDTYQNRSANVTIFARSLNTISMVGEGGYGGQGMSRISILTKVQ